MRTLFTQEEIALLEKNNYTHLVSKSMIKFTDDFKCLPNSYPRSISRTTSGDCI